MDCERWRVEVPGYLSGEIEGPDRAGLEEHLAVCEDCPRIVTETQEVVGLISLAALHVTPSPDLEEDVFGWLALEEVAGLVAAAPLEKDAPVDLERKALQRAGIFQRPLGRWPRVAAALAPGFAVAAVVIAVFAVNSRSNEFDPGERIQSIQFAGLTTPTMHGEGELYDSGSGDYIVVIEGDGLTAPPGYHYEIWMTGEEGAVFAGSFREAEVAPAILNVAVNPHEYPDVSIWLERDDTSFEATGEVVMKASIAGGPSPLQSATP